MSGEAFTMGLMTMIGPVVDTVDASVKAVFDSQVSGGRKGRRKREGKTKVMRHSGIRQELSAH